MSDHRRITGRLVIATHNAGKLAEMRELLAPSGVEAVSAAELGLGEPDETGTTFQANARIKALAAANATRLPAFADDSGLAVEALDGQPGIYSARWAGETRFSRRDDEDRALAPGARREGAEPTQGTLCIRSLRSLARRTSRRSRSPRRWKSGVATTRHGRFWLRSGISSRWPRAYFWRDDQHRKTRPAATWSGPVPSCQGFCAARGDVP